MLDFRNGKTSYTSYIGDLITEDGKYYYCGEIAEFISTGRLEKEPGGELRILDQKGKKVQVIEFPEEAPLYYYGITNDYVFFYDGFHGHLGLPYWYIEKDKIGTDQLEWKFVGEM